MSLPCLACAPKSSTFVPQVISRPRARTDPRWYPSVLPFRYNPCAGTDGSPDSLPSRTPVDSGPYQQVQPGGVTLDGALEMVRQSHQWKELKRIILVSPRGAETPAERTKEEYPRIIPVELRYRVGDESEIRAQTHVSETRSDSAESRRCRFLWASALCRICSSCIYSIRDHSQSNHDPLSNPID